MKKFSTSIMIMAALAMLAAACSPQAQSSGQNLPQATTSVSENQPGSTAGNPSGGVTAQSSLSSLSKMVGQEVKSATGQSIGDISGVVVSMANNAGVSVPQVEYVVVNAGPGLNVGDKAFYLPVSAFQNGQGGMVVNVDPTVLAKAPSFDAARLPDLSSANWDKEIAGYWSNQGMSLPVTGGDASGVSVMLNNAISELNVTGTNGDVVGQVRDFLIDPSTGQLRYAVIQAGTDLGNKYLPIPLSALNWQIDPNAAQSLGQMALTIDPSVLQKAPSFVDMNAINAVLSTWGPQVEAYWNSLSK